MATDIPASGDFGDDPQAPPPAPQGMDMAPTGGQADPNSIEAGTFDEFGGSSGSEAPQPITGPAGANPAYHQATQDTPAGQPIPGPIFQGRGLPGGSPGEKAAAMATAAAPTGLGKAGVAGFQGIGSLLVNPTTRAGAAAAIGQVKPYLPWAAKVALRHGIAGGLRSMGLPLPGFVSHALEDMDLVSLFRAAEQQGGKGAAQAPTTAAPTAPSAPKYNMPPLSDKFGKWQTPGGEDIPVGKGSSSLNARGGAIARDEALKRTMQRASSAKARCR